MREKVENMKLLFNLLQVFLFLLDNGVSGVGSDEVSVSVKEGDSVTLHTDVKTNQQEDIKWYFNDTRIAQISGDLSKICTDVQCNEGTERFRDRLKLDHQTGSLTIMNITNTDSGLYELHIGSSRISIIKSFSVTVPTVSDSGLSSAAVAGIVALCVGVAAVVLLLVAAVVIYYRKHQAGQHNNVTDMVMHFSNQMEKDPDDDSCQ